MRRFIFWLWHPEKRVPFFLLKALVFPFFYMASLFYGAGFHLWRAWHKIFGKKQTFGVRVISVGNLTVGGTGKSVVVRYLLALMEPQHCGVVMRGYGGSNEKKRTSLLVDGASDVRVVGDEAKALALATGVPIAVGADKQKALSFLCKKQSKINTVFLDDGYQSCAVHRALDIVLLDARSPFGNGFLLPAGPLRERSLARANMIVFTHANYLNNDDKKQLRLMIAQKKNEWFATHRVLFGEHVFDGIYQEGRKKVGQSVLRTRRFYVFAGIGSFQQFCAMLAKNGIKASKTHGFRDHYAYNVTDVAVLIAQPLPLLTTEKDWVKIEPLLSEIPGADRAGWFVARVAFCPLDGEQALRDCLMLNKNN